MSGAVEDGRADVTDTPAVLWEGALRLMEVGVTGVRRKREVRGGRE